MKTKSLLSGSIAAGLSLALLMGCGTTTPQSPVAKPSAVAVEIPVGNDALPGVLHLTGESEPGLTVVWFHGFPGLPEPDRAAIDALRIEGINVLTLHYRGSWGAPGTFSAAHALEDARAAIAFLRAPSTVDTYTIDSDAVVPVGDSFGSWVALQSAAGDPRVPCVGAALVLNLGELGAAMAQDEATRSFFEQMFADVDRDPELGFQFAADIGMAAELIAGRNEHDLERLVPALRARPVLLIGANADELAPVAAHLAPFADALKVAGNAAVTQKIYPGGHELTNATYAPLLASWLHQNCR